MSVTIIDHPLVEHRLTLMREVNCNTCKFRILITELARLMTRGASCDFGIEKCIIDGWCRQIEGGRIKSKTLTVVPILHVGLDMLGGVLDLIPTAKISVVGLQRNEGTLKPVSYFEEFVDSMERRPTLIIDPMLATDGSMTTTIDLPKAKGYRHIKALVLATALKGVKAVNEAYPDVTIYTAALDNHLNESDYIIPGLGDIDDRIFSTR